MTCPGRVTLQVHEPIAAPRIDSPTADDARDFAMRIEQIVRGGVVSDAQVGVDQVVGQHLDRAAGNTASLLKNPKLTGDAARER